MALSEQQQGRLQALRRKKRIVELRNKRDQQPTGLERAVDISEKITGAVAKPFELAAKIPVVGAGVRALGSTLGAIQKPFDIAAEAVSTGLSANPLAGTRVSPGVAGAPTEIRNIPAGAGAAIGTGISLIPDIALAAAGAPSALKAAKSFGQALTPGKVGKLGKAIRTSERGVDISGKATGIIEEIPLIKNLKSDLGLPNVGGATEVLKAAGNTIRNRLNAGIEVPLKVLSDFERLVSEAAKTPGKVGGELFQVVGEVRKVLNERIPGRSAATGEFRKAKRIQKALKIGTGASIGLGALDIGRRAITKALRK